jgi:hypothetical protein
LAGFDEVELELAVAAEVVAWDDDDDDDEGEEWAVLDEDVDWLELSPSDWLIGCILLILVSSVVDNVWGDLSRDEDISIFFF